ncbi:RNA helicase, activating signal cointegrator 1 [Scenedesmus sp. NREL 46B-D3]|nr:RNA helicase, activating signal cointegrator 1 [Scenedesmus sp. NREL 46B-D3]
MAEKYGGGAESYARFKQYDYRANSSLVLTSDTRTRDAHEPTGEPETLAGRKIHKMGDRAQQQRPEGLSEKKGKSKKREAGKSGMDFAMPAKRRTGGAGPSVLDMDTAGLYRPRTKETRAAYEALLNTIHSTFGDQPADVLRGAADEVLAVLKNQHMTDPERQKECESLLGSFSNERFAELVAIGKLINDFVGEGEAVPGGDGEGLDEDIGVAVEFEDEEEEEEDEVAEIAESDDDDAESQEEAAAKERALQGTADVDGDAEGAGDDGTLKVQEIDAYWLQRRISTSLGGMEAAAAQRLAQEVFEALQGDDASAVETRVVQLLGLDHFDLAKELLRNRLKIVWVSKLRQAQDEAEANSDGAQHPEEARRLRQGEGAAAGDEAGAAAAAAVEEGRARGGAAAAAAGAAAGRSVIDLDGLVFGQGGHFMSNKGCTLPPGSYRTTKKGYEEVHVPALKPKPYADGEKLVAITDLPDWAQPAFGGMQSLNRVQSRVCDTALYSSENMLVCAPTGAGKTNVAMLCILHELGLHRRTDGSIDMAAFKVVYVAPMKALVAEMVGNFTKRLGEAYGLQVRELTAWDVNLTKQEIEETQIIVTTPEKWDIITRKSDDRTYTQLVRLMIIDEIHLLHDTRGPVLESIVARTIRQIESTQEMTRIVGLSATLPNYDDVGTFLRVKPNKGLFYFDNSYRPCPLAQQYIGITIKKPLQRFQLMNEICYNKVLDCAGKHQVLIFVHSRKETAKTALYLKQTALDNDHLAKFMRDDSASREILQTEAEAAKTAELRDLLPFGFAIHHAGMSRVDRTLVEDLFADGHIQVLVSTATLAWGVNLPAHTVIIKGTQVYSPVKGAWDELSPQDMMQMMGRAGRPQYDTFGEGIIITGHTELQFYLSLFNVQLPIESQYIATIADNLNAEVVLGTVQNLKDAATWLGYTYLYVRMLRSPALYGVPLGALEDDPLLQQHRLDLAHSAALLLDKNNLIRYDRRTGNFQVTDLGRIASHYYITYTTLAAFNSHLKPTMGDIELLRLFSLADEFKFMIVREEEKLELAKLIDRVPVPVKESLDEPSAKINVLMQAYISNLKLEGLALSSDMVYVTQSAGRLMRCLFEICLKRGWAGLTDKAINLCKEVNHRMWSSQNPLRQFKGLPAELLTRLEKKDLPWERYYDLKPSELGDLIRMPKYGKALPRFAWDDKLHGAVEPFWLLVEDADGEVLLHHQYWLLRKALAEEEHALSFTVPVGEPLPPQYFVRMVSDRWIGCESTLAVSFRQLILPEKYPPPTELLDLQPLPVSALRNKAYEGYDSCFVCAPTGSGKTICAEFALLRLLAREQAARAAGEGGGSGFGDGKPLVHAVYVAPLEPLVLERYVNWKEKLEVGLGVKIAKLTGDSTTDVRLLADNHLVLATPQQWDMLSRRWKQRKAVQAVNLFIMDEMQLLGGQQGPTMEVVCSRMRYMSSQLPQPVRLVGLSHSLANARDVGEWLGAAGTSTFNFPPGVRPVPLEIHMHGLDIHNFEARMQAMMRPCYSAVLSHAAGGKPAIVFVPTRKHVRLTALDLLTSAAADGAQHRFRLAAEADLAPYVSRVKDSALAHALSFGVGYVHETMPAIERQVVEFLFDSGAIQVLVATAVSCWGMSSAAKLVVVMGTQYYDGSGLGASDYPVTDLLQMLGRASRPGIDEVGKVVLMCAAPRKEYYKKFLFEPLPIESHLDHFLHDTFNAEIVTRTIESKQDAVDYLTWTFFYRRLRQNPNYYNMHGTSDRHISEHLSDLVENTVNDLANSKVIGIEDEMDLSPLNLGMIASYYYITYTTIELFANSLTPKTKVKGLLEIVAAASEFDALPVRPGEEVAVERMIKHAPVAVDRPKYADPHTKVNALLQAHFSRERLSGDMGSDARTAVREAARLLQAVVDVVASSGWLHPALAAMEMCQMVVQGQWEKDSPLLQLPHFTPQLAAAAAAKDVSTVFDLVEMEDEDRRELLQLSDRQLDEVTAVCNRYPDISVTTELPEGPDVAAGDPVTLLVSLDREMEGGELAAVHAPRFPGLREEGWWLVVGNPKTNKLLGIKRVSFGKSQRVKLAFDAPAEVGAAKLTLFFMCDSWLGCDQEYEVELIVGEAAEGSGSEDMSNVCLVALGKYRLTAYCSL